MPSKYLDANKPTKLERQSSYSKPLNLAASIITIFKLLNWITLECSINLEVNSFWILWYFLFITPLPRINSTTSSWALNLKQEFIIGENEKST